MAFANYGYNSGHERDIALLPLSGAPRATSSPLDGVDQSVGIVVIPPTPVAPVFTRTVSSVSFICAQPDFDALFDNPHHFRFGYVGASFDDSGNSRLSDNHFLETPRGTIARSDSIMNHSFTDMVRKNSEHSQGFIGFRKRMARR